MTDISLATVAQMAVEAQTAIYESGNAYGVIGIQGTNGLYAIPAAEQGKQLITITREDGVLIKVALGGHTAVAGATVRMRKEGTQWVIKGNDTRGLSVDVAVSGDEVQKHNHNIGNPLFYPIDLASIADGLILPTGNGLEFTIGRVTYPKSDGALGIYESEDVDDLASAVTGLTANQGRWVVHYILRTDGTAVFFSATAVSGALNYTTHIEDAVAECLVAEPDAYPYAVTKIRAGMSTFGTYKALNGRSPVGKDMVRLGISGAMGGGSGGASDAADVTYTPAVLADWDGSADPGDVDNALDQLAERVMDVEGISAAPSTATYITQTADAGLSAEQALSTLATGLLAVTTTTGVISSGGTTGATDNALLRADGTGTKTVQASPIIVADTGAMTNVLLDGNGTGNVITNIGSSEINTESMTGRSTGVPTTSTDDIGVYYDGGLGSIRKSELNRFPSTGADGVVFTDPTTQSWTALNHGAGTYDATNTRRVIVMDDGNATAQVRGFHTPATSAPYTLRLYIQSWLGDTTQNGFSVGWRDNTTGELATIEFFTSSVDTVSFRVTKWTDHDTLSTNYISGTNVATIPNWFRLVDDNTNRIISVSPDGIIWDVIHSIGRTDFLTPDQIFFGLFLTTASSFDTPVSLLSYEVQ